MCKSDARKGVGCDTREGTDYDTVYRISGGEYFDVLQAVCQLLSFRPSRDISYLYQCEVYMISSAHAISLFPHLVKFNALLPILTGLKLALVQGVPMDSIIVTLPRC